ncbi:MAG: FTR1 family protein [Spirochaetales bacterium]|nr:FTR1 family protein [Spirochaetales bacterium]
MFSSFIIMFRETLEAALIIGIIFSYLNKTGQSRYNPAIYIGTLAGIIMSILGAYLFSLLAGGFEGRSEQIFEGIVMLTGAALLTTMIFWMMKQQHKVSGIEEKAEKYTSKGKVVSLTLLVFVSVLREGIESVFFLGALNFSAGSSISGVLIGFSAAVLLGLLIFTGSRKVSLKIFFQLTNILLVLFAAGLVSYGVHELQEAALLPVFIEHLWDINAILHEKGAVGSIVASLFGYNGNPSLIEVTAYGAYIIFAVILYRKFAH